MWYYTHKNLKSGFKTLNILKDNFNNKVLVTVQEAADTLGVSRSSVNNYINLKTNSLKSVKLGGTKKSSIRIMLVDLANFIDNLHTSKEVSNA